MEKKLRILIVDDEKSNISLLLNTLESDYIIQASKNGQYAMELANESQPDLILLDIIMPEMDGYTVCQKLKTNERTRHIPIIFITSKSEYEDETRGFQLGAVDYITKPFNPTIVKARVKTHLELKNFRDHLEKLVAERTRELENSNEKLKKQAKELDEIIITLRVLINDNIQSQKEFLQKVLHTIKEVTLPLLEKMIPDQQSSFQKSYLEAIESSLNNLCEPFGVGVNLKDNQLTPTEIQIANLIRDGKSSREIANLFGIAKSTVDWHRDNIRIKLGLKNKKVNLRVHLQNIQK